jgi:hypothetical protein
LQKVRGQIRSRLDLSHFFINVITEFISDIRTGTTYPNVASEYNCDIRTGTAYPNVASEFMSDIIRDELSYYINKKMRQVKAGSYLPSYFLQYSSV